MVRTRTCAFRRPGTSTYGLFRVPGPPDYVHGLGLQEVQPAAGRTHKDLPMKTAKWYAFRASMFLGSIAALLMIFPQSAKRW